MRHLSLGILILAILVSSTGCGGGNKITKGEKEFKGTEPASGSAATYPVNLPPDIQKKNDEAQKAQSKGGEPKK